MVQRVLVFSYIFLNAFVQVKSKTTITFPSVQPVYIKSGGELDLLCQQSDGFKVVWWKADVAGLNREYRLLDSSLESGFLTIAHVDGMYYMRLTKSNVQPSDSGSYKCSVQSGTDMPFLVDVHILKVGRRDGLATHTGNTTSMGCSLQDSDIRATVRWFKSDLEVAASSPTSSVVTPQASSSSSSPRHSKYRTITTLTDSSMESVLVVRNVGELDVGEYICMIELNEDYRFNHSVYLYSHPQIKSLGRSVNLAEGKTLDLHCRAWGWPMPNVTWSRHVEGQDPPSPLETSELFDWSTVERASFPTATSLRIDPLVSGDRAVYVCRAWSIVIVGNHTESPVVAIASVLVRVRGRFAPLLPLAGIFVEILILFIVIFFYERRRAAEKEERERKEVVGNQSNSIAQGHRHSTPSSEAGAAGGRHRKAR